MIDAFLGVSAYQPAKGIGVEIDSPQVKQIRSYVGGNLALQPTTQTRWYIAQLEQAQFQADAGDTMPICQLYRAMRRDGVIAGLLRALGSGITRLPKKYYGKHQSVADLQSRNGSRSVFDDMIPPAELSKLIMDGIVLGFGVAELVPVPGRDFPVMVRLEPEYLVYRWVENRWYYRSVAGLIPITPGDGRWVFHAPGARIAPWIDGLWLTLGRSYINKDHAMMMRSNYSAKLANAARVAVSPNGATEAQKLSWFRKVMDWGANTVFATPPGYDVKILEQSGRGYEVWQDEISTCDREIAIAICGQVVSVDGGTGFSNQDMHRAIRADIIKDQADQIAYTLNTQVIPQFVATRYGVGAIQDGAVFEYDIARPKDLKDEAASLKDVATAIQDLGTALKGSGLGVDLRELTMRYGIPTVEVTAADGRTVEVGSDDAPENDGDADLSEAA